MSKDFKIGFNARGLKISAAKVESEYNIFGGLYRQKTNMAWVLAHISVFSKNCPSCNENTGCKAFVSWSKTECANLEQRGGEVPIFKIEQSKMYEFFPNGHLQLNLCDVREHFVELEDSDELDELDESSKSVELFELFDESLETVFFLLDLFLDCKYFLYES